MRWSERGTRARSGTRGLARATASSATGLVLALVVALPSLAATPTPTAELGGDPRSSGQGPGLVGDPLLAILVVVGIGLVTLGATLLYVRMTGGPRSS
jgi:hypothetical protein